MVSQPYSEGRRPYARNLSPYVAYTERHLQLPIGETKAIRMTEPVYSDPVPQRKRIAVACSRCRKRKIRCSGDLGTGSPCTNCKNAGVEGCHFLRVQSHETAFIKGSSPSEYAYPVEEARAFAQREAAPSGRSYSNGSSSAASQHSTSTPHVYRSNTSFPSHPNRQYYASAVTSYSQPYHTGYYTDDSLHAYDSPHTLSPNTHVAVGQDEIGSRENPSLYGSGMYSEAETTYSYGKTANLPHRPALGSTEQASVSFTTAPPLLRSTAAERILPCPAGRQLSVSSVVPYVQALSTASPTPVTSGLSPLAPSKDACERISSSESGMSSGSYATADYEIRLNPENMIASGDRCLPTAALCHPANGLPGSGDMYGEPEHSLVRQESGMELRSYTCGESSGGPSTGCNIAPADAHLDGQPPKPCSTRVSYEDLPLCSGSESSSVDCLGAHRRRIGSPPPISSTGHMESRLEPQVRR